MNKAFSDRAWEDYMYWQAQDRKKLKKLNKLIDDISRTPYAGTGHPEPLKGELEGYWSRRIDGEHRLVYKVDDDDDGVVLRIAQCRHHYDR